MDAPTNIGRTKRQRWTHQGTTLVHQEEENNVGHTERRRTFSLYLTSSVRNKERIGQRCAPRVNVAHQETTLRTKKQRCTPRDNVGHIKKRRFFTLSIQLVGDWRNYRRNNYEDVCSRRAASGDQTLKEFSNTCDKEKILPIFSRQFLVRVCKTRPEIFTLLEINPARQSTTWSYSTSSTR